MKLLRARKPSPAMMVACIALFVALGGTSFAAVALTKNSVRSKHIKNGQVKRADLGANAINSAKVGDGLLLAQDFAPGQLPQGAKGDTGLQGPVGPTAGFGGPAFPTSSPDRTVTTKDVSLPAPGRLLVLGQLNRSTSCSTSNVLYGLYVDGTAVPGSGLRMPNGGATAPMTLVGISEPLNAGDHSLEIKSDCTEGDFVMAVSLGGPSISAVLLGS